MKRLWLGIILAGILLVSGFWVSSLIHRASVEIAGALESAAADALSGNFQTATAGAENAHARWESAWRKVAAVADHAPMDEIDSLFAQAQAYANAEQMGDFSAFCLRLSQLIRATADQHQPTWWNFL